MRARLSVCLSVPLRMGSSERQFARLLRRNNLPSIIQEKESERAKQLEEEAELGQHFCLVADHRAHLFVQPPR